MHIDNTALKTNNLAVLLIDMQPSFPTFDMDIIIPYQITVIRFCAEHNIPLFIITFDGFGKVVPVLLLEAQKVKTVFFIEKTDENAFKETSLHQDLVKLDIKNVFLMGINTGACVLSTAVGAREHHYNVITSPQVLADDDRPRCTIENSWIDSEVGEFCVIDDIQIATQMIVPQENEIIYPWSYRIERMFDKMTEAIFCRLRPFFTGWI